MYSWELPTTLEVGGESYEIRSDFRPALDIIAAFNDPQLPDAAKLDVMVTILYVSPPPAEYLDETVKKALWFLDCGRQDDGKTKPRTMDWEQDAAIIFRRPTRSPGMRRGTRRGIRTGGHSSGTLTRSKRAFSPRCSPSARSWRAARSWRNGSGSF